MTLPRPADHHRIMSVIEQEMKMSITKDSLDLLLDSIAAHNMRLINGVRKLSVDIVDGKHYYEVWEMPKYSRSIKWHYKGNDLYGAMCALEGDYSTC